MEELTEFRARVHRGTHEVGGSCIELACAGSRVVLDVGRPLSAGFDDEVQLPDVPGLADGSDPGLLGVVVSHAHLDHYGLIDQVSPTVPVYAGAAASAIAEAARFFSPATPALRTTGSLVHEVPMDLGPFTVTPLLIDHSAFDAYALIVDAGGRRLMYTGDFRGHGRKFGAFERLLRHPPEGVDTLVMEGTQVGGSAVGDARNGGASERDVEDALAATARDTPGLVMVAGSAQNVDRLVTCFKAARRTGRVLLVDLYGVAIARATGRATIPGPGYDGLAVWVPRRQRVLVKEAGQFERVRDVRGIRVFPEQIAAHPERYLIYTTSSSVAELVAAGALTQAGVVVWSMWDGYLDGPSGQRVRTLLDGRGIPMVHHHTSGHATVADLRRFVAAVKPGSIVPIHTEGADRFADLFPAVQVRGDGEWWSV